MNNIVILFILSLALFMGCTKGEIPSKSSSVEILDLKPDRGPKAEAVNIAPKEDLADRGLASVKRKPAQKVDFSQKAMEAMKAVKNCFHQSSGKSLFINTRNPAGFMLEADVTCTGEVARTLRNKLSEVDPQVNFQLSRSPNSEKIFFGKKEIVSNKKTRGLATLAGTDYTFEGSSCTKELPDIYSCELKFRMPLAERLEALIHK